MLDDITTFFENSRVFRNIFLNMMSGSNVSVQSEKATFNSSATNITTLVNDATNNLFVPFLNTCWAMRANLAKYNSEGYFTYRTFPIDVSAAMKFISGIEKNTVKLLDVLKNIPSDISANSSKTYDYVFKVTAFLDGVEKNAESLIYALKQIDNLNGEDIEKSSEEITTDTATDTATFEISKPVEVAKLFMSSLVNTTLQGVNAVDEAVKACSNFTSTQNVINSLIADLKNYSSTTEFLKDKCGIDFESADTGAITGSDAGGSTNSFNAEDIVPDSGAGSYPSSTTFTISGLTVTVPDKSTLTVDQKNIVYGLYSWWIKGGLFLIEDSYDLKFSDSGNFIKTLAVSFPSDMDSNTDAALAYQLEMPYEQIEAITLKINTVNYFVNLDITDRSNMKSGANPYIDRVIARELTNAMGASRIYYYLKLPVFIREGLANLTHGADDIFKDTIIALLARSSYLSSHLDITKISNSSDEDSAAGYVFMRYLTRQGAIQLS